MTTIVLPEQQRQGTFTSASLQTPAGITWARAEAIIPAADLTNPANSLLVSIESHPRRWVISLLVGNEAVNVAISSLTSALFIAAWGDWAKWLAIPVVVLGILLLGEVIPKTMGVRYPDKIAPAIASPVSRFVNLVGPAHWIIRKVVDGVFRLARVNPEPPSSYLTEEDFKDLIETSQREGALEEQEKHLIHRVFKFSDQTVRNIMTPRAAVFALPLLHPAQGSGGGPSGESVLTDSGLREEPGPGHRSPPCQGAFADVGPEKPGRPRAEHPNGGAAPISLPRSLH